jgi:DNA-binding transcriptional MerR regulator
VASRDASGNGDGSVEPRSEWIPLKEAAEDAGVSVSTLRNWYRKGQIDSRLHTGPRGKQRLVRKAEILERASDRSGGVTTARSRSSSSNGHPQSNSSPAPPSLPDLVKELGEAHERAARAEARAEFLSEELAKMEARFETLLRESPQETRIDDLDDGLPDDFPREEDDEYLPLVQRWRARRQRRKLQKKHMREVQLPN